MIKYLNLQEITSLYGEELKVAANRVIDSGWFLQGKENQVFEKNYSNYIGTPHCVGCANGLDALILIYRAYIEMGVMQPGDEVIVPANTYIASILAITENGLKPVLVEPRFDTLEIDDSKVEAAITERTKSIMIVHLYGRLAYTDKIGALCEKYHLKLVEDNAQAHGCMYRGQRTGSLGDAAGHSFYPGKNLGALGDGGAVTCKDKELADVIRALANYGSQKKYVFRYCGRNSRLDETNAAYLDVKLKHLDRDNDHRRRVAKLYIDGITNPFITLPSELPVESNVYHIFPVLCEKRDRFQAHLTANGVETLIHYPIPPHKQECYKEWNCLSFPITEKIHQNELSLPMSPCMTKSDTEYVIDAINSFTI